MFLPRISLSIAFELKDARLANYPKITFKDILFVAINKKKKHQNMNKENQKPSAKEQEGEFVISS